MADQRTLFSDFLSELGVPHTACYSNSRFASMPFRSLFGLTKLLQEYGVDSEGYRLGSAAELDKLTPPFLAYTPAGFLIVTSVTPGSVCYLSEGQPESVSRDEFGRVWNGVVLAAYPSPSAQEPGYALHAREEFFNRSKKWVLLACVLFLLGWLFITNGIYRYVSTVLLTIFDLLGLYLTYMLVQKSLKIDNRHADRVCGVLQAGGCDDILATKASKFFGLFGWSEVGFAYFSVSLLALLVFPQSLPWLALCNVCCLPFTVWSIWYQRFRAHIWCTLCVSVQCTLWLLFFCYLGGGWLRGALPLKMDFFILGACYVAALLGLNAVMPFFDNSESKTTVKDEKTQNNSAP